MNEFIKVRAMLDNYILNRDLETPEGSKIPKNISDHLTKARTKSFNEEQNQAFDDGYDAGYINALIDVLDSYL